ncbi:MAG: CPBP family intramembrane metalloprotease [Planctomycetota bacterium]|jgi:membrane protease YdiL (CAAX protease family)|nr:CPBP family intramembrane metalloprotease [Planctomycetota bacterium]
MDSERTVKKKAWGERESGIDDFRYETAPGFSPRNLWRFFLVDLIAVMSLRLLYSRGLIPGIDAYVLLTLAGKIVLAGYLAWMIRDAADGWGALGVKTGGSPLGWLWGTILYAIAYPGMHLAGRLNFWLLGGAFRFLGWGRFEPEPQEVALILLGGEARSAVCIALLAFAVLIGPVMEEAAFRGVGMDGFGRTGGAWSAAIWTSTLFGLYHFDPSRILPLAVMGFAMAGAGRLSRTLWCPVVLHIFHNSFTLWMMAKNTGKA